jgi:hypothetical protein
MQIKTIKLNNSSLVEGVTYQFRIDKKIRLDDDEDVYILADPMGYKIMMPAGFYEDYGFEIGQTINCRVDKRSCSGQIYLEPEHPFYKENEKYEFDLLESGIRKNILDEDEQYFVVSDVLKRKWIVVASNHFDKKNIKNGKLLCLVERIKKGHIYLCIPDDIDFSSPLKIGNDYDFEVIGEKINPDDNFKYFVLKRYNDGKHLLKKKYYEHYKIKIGDKISCRVVKFSSSGTYILEPENPHYENDKIYEFKVKRFEEFVFSDGVRQLVIVLEDLFKEENIIDIDEDEFERLKDMKIVRAEVLSIRKSRLELKII